MKARKLIAMLLVVATLMSFAPMAVFAAEGDTYVVTVQYKAVGGPLNGREVAAAWSGSFGEGSEYNTSVTLPVVEGYVADSVDAQVGTEAQIVDGKLEFGFANLNTAKTIVVTYVPAAVGMTVEYYQQNAENDEYTWVHTATFPEAKTGDPISKYVSYENDTGLIEVDGSYALWFDSSKTVAADGKTLVEVYYDREYYLLSFDLGGGYGVDPQFLRYGETVETVGIPVRPGYTFKGWDVAVPTTMPANNLKLTAQWEAVDTAKVTIVYWGENANDENYSYINSAVTSMTPGTLIDGTNVTATYYCGLEAHTHTSCTLADHTHGNACCTLVEHTHSTDCCDSYYHSGRNHTCNTNDCANGGVEHTHGDGSCVYSATCYTCGKTAHTHTSACSTNSMANTALWTYVKSDNVEVAADGSTVINVYYDRTSFTLTFKATGNNGSTLGTITDKWGANIATRFKTVSDANTYLWSMTSDGEDPWTSYLPVMPTENRTYYAKTTSSNNVQSAQYIGEDLSGNYTVDLWTTSVKYGSGLNVTEEEFIEIEGFTFNADKSTGTGSDYDGAEFYYTRNSYNLTYMSGSEILKTESIKYEQVLTAYSSYKPTNPPSYLEAGAYVFGGWYQNPECTGEPFDFSQKMPAKNQIVYAKWVPITHNVDVYLDDTLTTKLGDTQVVNHRDFATAPEGVTNEPYTFVAWFYKDENGNEKAFDFASMQITKDMVVYGKWKATDPVDYTIVFVTENGDVVADPVNGKALPFTKVTVEAKVGEDLYAAYQEGWFPTEASSTRYVTGNAKDNVYEVVYVSAPVVPYTVKYLLAGTEQPMSEVTGNNAYANKTVSDNTKVVVTENALIIPGYLADAPQKRLIVTADGKAELIFYYTENNTQAYIQETHYKVKDGVNYVYQDLQPVLGTIGENYSRSALTITNYVLSYVTINGEKWTGTGDPTAELTNAGLHFEFYYIPNEFYVYHQSNGTVETYALPQYAEFDVTTTVYDNYLYGGLYTDKNFTEAYTYENLAAAYNGDPTDGMHLTPAAGETYYLKEVDNRYIRPGMYHVYDTRTIEDVTNGLQAIYLVTGIDDTNYMEVGFTVGNKDISTKNVVVEDSETVTTNENAVHDVFSVKFLKSGSTTEYDTNKSKDYTVNDFFKGTGSELKGHLYVHSFDVGTKDFTYGAYFVTPDGIRVDGVKTRHVVHNGTNDGMTKELTDRASTCTDVVTTAAAEAVAYAPLTLRSSYDVMGQATTPVYTITKVDGKTTDTYLVRGGDHTGTIGYTEKAGYVFAGWYTNKACTKPADFSDIQSDMTVYPKYVSAKQVTTKTTALGKLMTVNVSVPGTDLTQVGVSYTLDGETTNVLCKKSQSLISGLKKLLGSKSTTYTASWNMKGLTNGDTFTVTSYWVTADGTMVEIETNDFAYARNRISVQ